MSRCKTFRLVLLGLFVVGISAFMVRTLSQAGQFTTIKNLRTGTCTVYKGVKAPEDIVVDRQTHTAFFSSLDRKRVRAGGGDAASYRGAILSFDLKANSSGNGQAAPVNITPDMPKDFHPVGLSLFVDDDGNKRLFVVNQATAGNHTVEIFELVAKGLVHKKTVGLGAGVVFANDVLAVGKDMFYVTDSAGGSAVSSFLDFAVQRKRSKVFYHDGDKLSQVADGFVMANGIAVSADGEQVYVSDTSARSLRFFKRDKATGALEDSGVLFIGTGVDNIDVASDGSLWMAAHPKLIDLALALKGVKSRSSSQVIHAVAAKKGGGGEVRTTYLDLGDEISGSSVAVTYDNNLIIGSVLDDKFVICSR